MNRIFVPPDFDGTDPHTAGFPQSSTNKVEGADFHYQQEFADKITAGKQQKMDHSLFNSSEFVKENTLLTNTEDYAKKIRTSADRYKAKVCQEAKIIKTKIELELANALLVKKEAEEKASKLVNETQAGYDKAVLEGQEKGYAAGLKKGLQQAESENRESVAKVSMILKEVETLWTDLTLQYEKQIAELCLQIAQKIINKNIQSNTDLVLQMVKGAIQQFEGQGNIKIRINPEEYELIIKYQDDLNRFLDEDQMIRLQADSEVSLASAVIESDFSVVDLDINEQFLNLQKAIRVSVDERRISLEQ
jgi:flagellar assembly protein FliH